MTQCRYASLKLVHLGVESKLRGGVQSEYKSFQTSEDIKKANLEGGLTVKKTVIQGLGNVGYHAAKFLEEEDGAQLLG